MLKMKIIFHILVALTVPKQVSKFSKTFLVLIGLFGSIVVVVEGDIIPLYEQNADISTLELKFSSFKKGDGVGANKLLNKPIKSQNTSNIHTTSSITTSTNTVGEERSLENECLLVCKLSKEKCGQIYKELGQDLNAILALEKLEMCKVFEISLNEKNKRSILKYRNIRSVTVNTTEVDSTAKRPTQIFAQRIPFPPTQFDPSLPKPKPKPDPTIGIENTTTYTGIIGGTSSLILNIILPLSVSFVVLSLISFYFYKKWRKARVPVSNPHVAFGKMLKFIENNVDIDNLKANNPFEFICKILKSNLETKFETSDDLSKGICLGKGKFGIVYEGVYKGEKIALKFALKDDGPDSDPYLEMRKDEQLKVEIRTLQLIPPHENIIKFIGAFNFDGEKTLAMELCNELNLLDTLKSQMNHTKCKCDFGTKRPLGGYSIFKCEVEISKENLIKWSKETASAMSHLNLENILHIDLGCKNILLVKDETGYSIRISDFGFAKILDDDNPYYTCLLKYKEFFNLPRPSPPDAKCGKKYYTEKSDVWSYGLTLAEIFSIGRFERCEKKFYDAVSSFESDTNNSAEYQSYINKKLKEYPLISEDIYQIIVQCLGIAEERKKFAELLEIFTKMEQNYSYQF